MAERLRSRAGAPWRSRRSRFSVTVLGCGLIGASVARAVRRRWPAATIAGSDRAAVLRRAIAAGVLDRTVASRELDGHLSTDAVDLVVLAMPVDIIVGRLPAIAATLSTRPPKRRPLVIDVGSVKAPVLQAAERSGCPRFVGGHPMAGGEHGGLDHADAALFDGRRFVLCPSASATKADRDAARSLVVGVGAEAIELSPDVHDRCVAMISHAPHLIALAMMDAAGRQRATLPGARRHDLPWRLAAGSWRDATRVAAADPHLWQAIVQLNREHVIEALDEIVAAAKRLRSGLADAGPNSPRRRAGSPADPKQGVDARALARERRRIARYLP